MRMMITKISLKTLQLVHFWSAQYKQKEKQIKTFGNVSLPKEFYHLLKDSSKQSQIITRTAFKATERANNWHILPKSHSIQNGDNDLISLKDN